MRSDQFTKDFPSQKIEVWSRLKKNLQRISNKNKRISFLNMKGSSLLKIRGISIIEKQVGGDAWYPEGWSTEG